MAVHIYVIAVQSGGIMVDGETKNKPKKRKKKIPVLTLKYHGGQAKTCMVENQEWVLARAR